MRFREQKSLFHIIRNKRLLVINGAGFLGMGDPDKAGAHYGADNPLHSIAPVERAPVRRQGDCLNLSNCPAHGVTPDVGDLHPQDWRNAAIDERFRRPLPLSGEKIGDDGHLWCVRSFYKLREYAVQRSFATNALLRRCRPDLQGYSTQS